MVGDSTNDLPEITAPKTNEYIDVRMKEKA